MRSYREEPIQIMEEAIVCFDKVSSGAVDRNVIEAKNCLTRGLNQYWTEATAKTRVDEIKIYLD